MPDATQEYNFEVTRGDTIQLPLTVYHLSGILSGYAAVPQSVDTNVSAANISAASSSATFICRGKYAHGDSDASAIFTLASPASGISVTSASGGQLDLLFAPGDTSVLPPREVPVVWDLQMILSTKVYTLIKGEMLVKPDVTISTGA